jgi:signal transduction histidine kinase/CheY-like chemotaxis protein
MTYSVASIRHLPKGWFARWRWKGLTRFFLPGGTVATGRHFYQMQKSLSATEGKSSYARLDSVLGSAGEPCKAIKATSHPQQRAPAIQKQCQAGVSQSESHADTLKAAAPPDKKANPKSEATLDAHALPFVWDALLSELAHELNSPLSSLKGMLEVFSQHPGLGHSDRANLLIMCRAAENIECVLTRARKSMLGKIQGPTPGGRSLFDVNKLLSEELHRSAQRCERLGVKVILSRSSTQALCYGQEELLREALFRVVCNSLDAFSEDDDHEQFSCENPFETRLNHSCSCAACADSSLSEPELRTLGKPQCVHRREQHNRLRCHERLIRLTVDAEVSKGIVRIVHQDNAGGMSQEILQECTHPFFSTKPKALGLGLVVAKSAVERLGGQFEIQSAEGFGTTLHFTLRLVPESLRSSGLLTGPALKPNCTLQKTAANPTGSITGQFEQEQTSHQSSTQSESTKRHLVVVDDDETVIALLQIYLSGTFRLTCCGTASLALGRIQSQGCDAILTDLRMPAVSGLDLSTQIRALFPNLPVIVMSGNTSEAKTLVDAGAFTGMIEKPFGSRSHLLTQLNNLLPHLEHGFETPQAF